MTYINLSKAISICLLFALLGCNKPDDSNEIIADPSLEIVNLTSLPFGGVGETQILIRNQGDPLPDVLSLWLCGLPSNGAGANNANDWTNPDETWDYTPLIINCFSKCLSGKFIRNFL